MKSVLKSLVFATMLVLGACAKDNGSSSGTPADVAAVPNANGCAAGQVYTQYGCLAQSSCPVNYGLYNNQCIPATVSNMNGACAAGQVYTQYGCVAQGGCPVNQGYYNNTCIQGYANNNSGYYGNGNGGYYNSYYYQNRNAYYGNGGGYYGNPYAGGYYGGAGIGAGFYIGGQVRVPGMYYGY